MTARRLIVRVLVVIAIAVAAWYGVVTWLMCRAAVFRHYDRTAHIAAIANQDLVADGAILILNDHGTAALAFMGSRPDPDAATREYVRGPGQWSPAVIDVLEPETRFRLVRLRERRSEWTGSSYRLDIRIESGRHRGASYEAWAYEIMRPDADDHWSLLPFVRLADTPAAASQPAPGDG
jgi:hypothetical protein